MTICACTVTILNFNRQCPAAIVVCVTIQTACITGNRFFPAIIRRLHTVTSCTEFRRVRFLCSYHNQRNTAYERDDSYYGQYYDTLSISFSNILQHDINLPRMFTELYSVAIKGLRNLGIEELETVYGKFMNFSILQSFNS